MIEFGIGFVIGFLVACVVWVNVVPEIRESNRRAMKSEQEWYDKHDKMGDLM